MNDIIYVSIKKKILIYFVIMFGIIAVGASVFLINKEKSEQKLAVSLLIKDTYALLDNLAFYTKEIQRGKLDNLLVFKNDIDRLESYLLIFKNGGEFTSEGRYFKLEQAKIEHQQDLQKLFLDWEDFKALGISITSSSSTAGQEKILILSEKNEFIQSTYRYLSSEVLKAKEQSEKIYLYILLILVLSSAIGLLLGYNFILNSTIKPISDITAVSKSLALGETIDKLNENKNDEIGDLYKSINLLNENLSIISRFANAIGTGNFDAEFEARGENDSLGQALLNMRNNLRRVTLEDNKRNWTNENLAEFGELLRIQNENIDELSFKIINKLVSCMKANQGGFFILTDDGDKLELKSAYAYEKRKFIEKLMDSDAGLAGQCLQEKKPIYIKEIPEDYMEITSGLGSSRPASMLLLPLLYNETGYGVIEICSFEEIDEYKIKFAETVAEDIASSLSILKANSKTKILLQESQHKNELIKGQEKAMREKIMELEGQLEEWARKEKELEGKNTRFKKLIDKSPYGVMVLKIDKKVAYFNNYVEKFYRSKGIYIGRDISITQLLPSNELKLWHYYLEMARKGEIVTEIVNWKHIEGHDIYLQVMISAKDNSRKTTSSREIFDGWVIRINDITSLQPVRW